MLDPSAVRRWCTGAVAALEAARAEIDRLNVYPVPDGDTGTNLLLTLQAADSAVRTDPPGDLAATLGSMARGAVLGARGNSGVILSQVLRGLADVDAGRTRRRAALAKALARAAELAWTAVAEPVEGTMLSVVRAAAEAAGGAGDSLAAVARAAAGGAARRWTAPPTSCRCWPGPAWSTPAAAACACCWSRWRPSSAAKPVPLPKARSAPAPPEMARETGSDAYGYEVQYLLDAADVTGLRAELAELGDSLVVVGTGEGTWTVHVHVNDIGAAIEAGVRAGRPHRITVTRFADEPPARREGTAVVAVAPGAGVAELFAAEGVLLGRRHRGRDAGRGARRRHRRRRRAARPGRADRARGRRRSPGQGRRCRGRRGADPLAGAGAGRGGRARRGPPVRRRRDRDGRGRGGDPVGRGFRPPGTR